MSTVPAVGANSGKERTEIDSQGLSKDIRKRVFETILIAEDDPPLRRILDLAAVRLGYGTLVAPSGEIALELWTAYKKEVSLVVTDLVMPGGMSGLQLMQRIQVVDPALPVLVITCYPLETFSETLPMSPFIQYLKKPFHMFDFGRAIRRGLDRRLLERTLNSWKKSAEL